MTREEAIEVLKLVDENASCDDCLYYAQMEDCPTDEDCIIVQAGRMAIQALEQMPEATSTMQTGQFDYVPIRDAKGISCTECKYFKVTQEPLRGTGGLIDLGQARCEKHDLIKDFSHNGQFKYLKPCEYYEDFREGAEHDRT